MKNFDFVDDLLLRERIEGVRNDIATLGGLLRKQNKAEVKSCLRKTMIIYIASIIEALLLWKLKKETTSDKVVLSSEWKYLDLKKFYATDEFELIAGKRKQEVKKISDLDFNRTIDVCEKYRAVKSANLIKDLHKVRKLRNELHIGGIAAIRKTYTQNDLKFVFDTLGKTVLSMG